MHSDSHAPSTPSSFVTGPDRVPGPRDLAALQRDTLTVMARSPAIFLLLPALAFLPFDFLNELVSSSVGNDDLEGTLRGLRMYHRVGQWIELGVGSFVAATVLMATVAVGEGRSPTFGEAIKAGTSAWGRALKTTFVSGVFVGFASLLFIVPGFVLATRYMLAVPASVIDGDDSNAARARSTALVKERGTFRLFLWGAAAIFSWYVLSFLPTFTVAMLMPDTTTTVLECAINAVVASVWNIVGAGLVVAAGLLYLELSGRSALWPVGLELRGADGRRVEGPKGTGQVGLLVVGAIAGLAALVLVPIVVLSVWLLLDEDGVTAFLERSPLLQGAVDLVLDEPAELDAPSSALPDPADRPSALPHTPDHGES